MGFIILVYGLVIGSFLNVVIYRVPAGESIVRPPSHCGVCNQRLKILDLIPIISYLFLRGRCRYCNAKISIRYPLVELMTGVLFLLCYYFFGIEWKLLFILVYVSLLIAITLIDLDHQIIPDGLLIFGAIFAIVEKVIQGLVLGNNLRILDSLYGMLVGGGVFLLIAVVSNGGMGGGDIKLMALLGFIFGFRPIVIIAMLAFIIGAVISVLLLVTKIKSRKDPVPFGPFIALSALLVIFLEERIVYWYITNMIL